jgi:hypothetical protein
MGKNIDLPKAALFHGRGNNAAQYGTDRAALETTRRFCLRDIAPVLPRRLHACSYMQLR